MNLNRHQIRSTAFQILFVLNSNPTASVEDAYKTVLKENHSDEITESDLPDYLKKIVRQTVDNQAQLDEIITSFLRPGWRIDRLSKTDLVILRLALTELQEQNDQVPVKVIINEALELAKEFSDDSSRKFINGVLSEYARKKGLTEG